LSFFKTCEDCQKEINSYEYIFCDECLKKHLKCQGCTRQITKDDDRFSEGQMLCRVCYKVDKLIFYRPNSFCLLIKDRLEKLVIAKYQQMSDSELESAWQSSADVIGMYAMKSWHCPKNEEQQWRDKAEETQALQGIIQNEITRRARN